MKAFIYMHECFGCARLKLNLNENSNLLGIRICQFVKFLDKCFAFYEIFLINWGKMQKLSKCRQMGALQMVKIMLLRIYIY